MKKQPAGRGAAKPRRVRRTAEDARTAILDATERRLVEHGPNGIRLQEVAADVGMSHPTILHHFGSREHLVEAAIERRVRAMNQEVILALLSASTANKGSTAISLFESLHQSLAGGHARVMAFCALEGRTTVASEGLRPLAQATHAARLARRPPGKRVPDLEETQHIVHLGALALLADAMFSGFMRGESSEARDAAASKRFRAWLAKQLVSMLEV
jgi:AcrR family transcriptional regulator